MKTTKERTLDPRSNQLVAWGQQNEKGHPSHREGHGLFHSLGVIRDSDAWPPSTVFQSHPITTCHSPNRRLCHAPGPELEGKGTRLQAPLRRKGAASSSLVSGMLGSVLWEAEEARCSLPASEAAGHAGWESHTPGPGAQWLSGSESLQSIPLESDWLLREGNRCLLPRRTPTRAGWDKGNSGDKALKHSLQETRIALIMVSAPRPMNALCREIILLSNSGC